MLGLFIFKIWPCIQIIITSLKDNYDYISGDYSAVNFENYNAIFSDSYFIQAIVNTVLYMFIVVIGTTLISLLISWCLFRIKKCSGVFRVVFFLPLISSDIAIGISWRLMFNRNGVINALLNAFSIDSINWLSDKKYSFLILVLYGIWSSLPITIFLLYSALQRLNSNLLISAQIDHASEFNLFVKIIYPLIKTTVVLSALINCISSWLVINGLFPLFSGLPGPFYNLYTMVYYIYNKIGEGNRSLGEACAASVVLLSLVAIFLITRCFYGKKNKEIQ